MTKKEKRRLLAEDLDEMSGTLCTVGLGHIYFGQLADHLLKLVMPVSKVRKPKK